MKKEKYVYKNAYARGTKVYRLYCEDEVVDLSITSTPNDNRLVIGIPEFRILFKKDEWNEIVELAKGLFENPYADEKELEQIGRYHGMDRHRENLLHLIADLEELKGEGTKEIIEEYIGSLRVIYNRL